MSTLISDEQLEKIIMYCPDEDTNYPVPEVYLNKDGTCKYAYVTLVMLGDLYVSGAIVLAHSIRKCGSNVDLIVLITPDVTEEGKSVLGMFFSHVIRINYVDIHNWRSKKHKKYLDLVFTKFHAFNLTQYDKILLIDADALVLKHPDHLFTLDAPAGCFLENKNMIISYDDDGNYIYPEKDKLEWYEKMCKCCGHGKKIDKSFTNRIKKNFMNSGIGGGLILLKPDGEELDRILDDLSKQPMKSLVEEKFVWPEQQYLCLRYSGQWTSINPRFFGLQGYPHWKILYGLQYAGDKPFILSSKFDITERVKYPDFILWHYFFQEILEKYPHLKSSKALHDANEINPFFFTYIQKHKNEHVKAYSRHVTAKYNTVATKEIINNLFHIDQKKINQDHLKYYHVDKNTDYIYTHHTTLYDDIKEYDFMGPIKKLSEYFGEQSYYSKILKFYNESYKNIKEPLDKQLPETFTDPLDKDLIALEYIKCRKNMFVVTVWPIVTKNISEKEIIDILSFHGNVCYVKKLTITKKGLYNLMFWMYDEFTYSYRHDFISKKIEYIHATSDNEIILFFLDNVNNSHLAGQGSPAKKDIRNKLSDKLKSNNLNLENVRGNDLVHINDYFYQTVQYAQMVLNENTISMLEEQSTENIALDFMSEPILKIQTYKKWCLQNLSMLQRDRLLIMGGVVLFSYGFRKSNDIDSIFVSIGENTESEKKLKKLLAYNFCDKRTKFPFADIGIENSEYWRDSWTEKNTQILSYFGIDNFIEVITDPRNHFFFQGFKCYLLKHEILRKIYRNKTHEDHSDFIILSHLYPEIVSQYLQFNDGQLKYLIGNEQTPPDLSYEYLKELMGTIYKKYPQGEIIKFKKKLNMI